MHLRPLVLAAVLVLSPAATALADPAPDQVEVRDAAGLVVGAPVAGRDAVQAAVARVRTARLDDSQAWEIVAGAGTYGDAVIDEPALTLRPAAGAAVVVSGTGGSDGTGGECIDVRRGGVVVDGITCRAPAGRGVEVHPPSREGGIVLRNLVIDRPGTDGVAVLSGDGILIENVAVTSARQDGLRFQSLTGQGPYRVQGGAVRLSGDDGVDLVDDVQRLTVSGAVIEGSRDNGVESDDSGSSDLLVESSTIVRSGDNGVEFGGGGLRLGVVAGLLSENGDYGASFGKGSGFSLRRVTLDGTNRAGDVRYSSDPRAGGAYERLDLAGSVVDLPGEPRGVVVSALTPTRRDRLTALPAGLVAAGPFVRLRDAGRDATSLVTLRFPLNDAQRAALRTGALAVWEDDPGGNRRRWQEVPGTVADATGAVQVTLGDRQIASGSDARTAVYAPLAPPNGAPAISAVYPAEGQRVTGRGGLLSARVGDDQALGTGSFMLTIDGVRRGGVAFRDGLVTFRPGRLRTGVRRARLVVVDASGLVGVREWTFRVVNGRPSVVLRRARPRPGAVVRAGRVRVLVPLRDDGGARTLRAGLTVDGRRVAARVRGTRVVAHPVLAAGRHRLRLTVVDRQGARTTRAWTVRATG